MPWSKYDGQSVGRIIQFIYRYAGLHIAERVQIGYREVTLSNNPFATFEWEGDVPHFVFAAKYDYLNKIQANKKAEVIEMEEEKKKLKAV
jgi:hypothetical protein